MCVLFVSGISGNAPVEREQPPPEGRAEHTELQQSLTPQMLNFATLCARGEAAQTLGTGWESSAGMQRHSQRAQTDPASPERRNLRSDGEMKLGHRCALWRMNRPVFVYTDYLQFLQKD